MDKFIIKEQPWDTDFFGYACARVTLNAALSEAEFAELLRVTKKYAFITLDNACADMNNCRLFGTMSNAFLTDCPVELKRPLSRDDALITVEDVCIAKKGDGERLAQIASNSFVYSRFSSDSLLDSNKVSELYASWVKNALASENKAVYTTEEREGFLIIYYDENACHIDLIATDATVRRRHVGSRLVNYAVSQAAQKGCEEFYVGTQALNTPALNLYTKSGFKIYKTSQIFHLHNNV